MYVIEWNKIYGIDWKWNNFSEWIEKKSCWSGKCFYLIDLMYYAHKQWVCICDLTPLWGEEKLPFSGKSMDSSNIDLWTSFSFCCKWNLLILG